MRKQFVKTLEAHMACDERIVLLLGDIGVFGFKKSFNDFPDRVYNIGILEPAMVSLASGLAKTDLIPVVHTIAPFLAERSFEQLKIDFGYQSVGGNFVTVGASYDYAALGCTHHCPGDVGLMQNIPGMQIVAPGTPTEFDELFGQAYDNGHPTYYRLSEQQNSTSQQVSFGKANILKGGAQATVVAVGPCRDIALEATEGIDVGVIYYTTLFPFDEDALRENIAQSGKVLVVEPFYSGTLVHLIASALFPNPTTIDSLGVPRKFLTHYGSRTEHDTDIGFTPDHIRTRIERLVRGY
jgi:transketolase